jgi:predicted amino acid dehydrogenase
VKHILSIAYSLDTNNFDEILEFKGERVRLTQFSTNFDFNLTKNIIQKYDGQCDVIVVTGIPPKLSFKGNLFSHPQAEKIRSMAKQTPMADGQVVKDVYIPWAIRQFYLKNKSLMSNKKIAFYSGALQKSLMDVVVEFGCKLIMADPYFFAGLPFNLTNHKQLENFIKFLTPVFKRMKIKRSNLSKFDVTNLDLTNNLKEFFDADIFVGNESTFNLVNLEHLRGKTVIVDFLSPGLERRFKQVGVGDVIVCMPQVIDNPNISFGVLEGLFISFGSSLGIHAPMNADDVLKWIDNLKLSSELKELNQVPSGHENKFAFIIHPLSADMIFKHPLLKFLKPYSKPLERVAEELMALSPGFYYGRIKGIVSEKTGKEVEGLIYTVTETPKKLMESDPNTIYKKLTDLCHNADRRGASIIGLGAYTKIVGDAGVTVANQSPIPVTTGNSLSACSTLWAAKFAIDKLGFVEKKDDIYQGRVMVVGATGSIGAVSAKILAKTWREVVLVAPRAYKLLELKEEIQTIAPGCLIEIGTSPDNFSGRCDLIITTTSSRGKKIMDILDVKPGCVICDVSRPFDIKENDALQRPDVMVIASGEVQLPGKVDSNVDIGLEGNIVYACLAETALLAMAGKFESFTLSRNISYEKVLEIDILAREHGVRLASIMGHGGFITDEEFNLCRVHALGTLKDWES